MNPRAPLLLALALLLAACGKVAPDPRAAAQAERPAQPAAAPWQELKALPPEQAWAGVRRHPQSRRERLQLELLEIWAGRADWDAVRAHLGEVAAAPAQPAAHARVQHLRARERLAAGDAEGALEALALLPDSPAAWEARIRIHGQLNDTGNQIFSRLRYARLLAEPAARARQHRIAWDRLSAAPLAQLRRWRSVAADSIWRGWLDPAPRARPGTEPLLSTEEVLGEWRLHYSDHPGREWLPVVRDILLALEPRTYAVAALLPITGESASIGRALRAGIEERMREVASEAASLRIYDTSNLNQPVRELYRQAVADGAERIIGPLEKNRVTELLRLPELPVPVVSLNYLDAGQAAPPGLLQFGLRPEDEAEQAARRARSDGRAAALVFAPDTPWGRRLSDSFAQRFAQHGGAVKSRTLYSPNSSSHAEAIKAALKLADGERRKLRVERALGREVVARPTRRQDIDMVFLASSPRNARLLKPQLDYYYADDLPIYATSHIYEGTPNPLLNQDLERVQFCDIPVVLEGAVESAQLSAHSRRLPRLVALGADAYLLATRLNYLNANPGAQLPGWTGLLSRAPGQRIYRQLPWAVFRKGRAVPQAQRESSAPAPHAALGAAPAGGAEF